MRHRQASSNAKITASIKTVVASKALAIMDSLLPERLVVAEVGDGQPQRVDGDERVGDLVPEDEDDVCGERFPAPFAVIIERVVDLVEVDGGLVRGLPEVLEG